MGTVTCDRPLAKAGGSNKRGFPSSGLNAGSTVLFGLVRATPRSDDEYWNLTGGTRELDIR
jgi:hypothetical protein